MALGARQWLSGPTFLISRTILIRLNNFQGPTMSLIIFSVCLINIIKILLTRIWQKSWPNLGLVHCESRVNFCCHACFWRSREHCWGYLGGSVRWVSDSWFQLRSWSQGCGIKARIRLCTEHGACLRFSLSPPLPFSPVCVCSLSLSKIVNK